MNLNRLLQQILRELEQEQRGVQRTALIIAPILLFSLIALATLMARGGWEFLSGATGTIVLMAHFAMLTEPAIKRVRGLARDVTIYLALPSDWDSAPLPEAPQPRTLFYLYGPSILTGLSGIAIFAPVLLAETSVWQQIAGVMLGVVLIGVFCHRFAQTYSLIRRLEISFADMLTARQAPHYAPGATAQPRTGLLDQELLARLEAQSQPVERLSPAARALIRTERYLLLRDAPDTSDIDLQEAVQAWAKQASTDELGHWLLPPIGGKIYLPLEPHGLLASTLATTARRLGMDGGYSASLNTWLIRLPPARSYAVAARLIDALVALGIFPPGQTLIHHLTVAGDLGSDAVVPALLYLAATPLIFEPQPNPALGDDHSFIMRGGGVMDDLDRGQASAGSRTDFADGFLFVDQPAWSAVEHITGHVINLRLKQVLAWAAYAASRAPERRSTAEAAAAARYDRLRGDLAAFLSEHDLHNALTIRWLDGRWSEQWPYLQAISERKQADPRFLASAQQLRDTALDDLEQIALRAAGQRRTT
jgi:hypothetical protein